jgi:hypothetical protein
MITRRNDQGMIPRVSEAASLVFHLTNAVSFYFISHHNLHLHSHGAGEASSP